MPMDLSQIGREIGPNELTWTPDECALYALGVGAGVDELAFTTENTEGAPQRVLPTLVGTIGRGGGGGHVDPLSFGTYGIHQVLHAAERIELFGALPPRGRVLATLRVAGIWDKRAAALVQLETEARAPGDGALVYRTVHSLLVLGEGGFGGERGPVLGAQRHPPRPPDHVVLAETRPEQALLYRLSGDHNRIHSDPAVARLAGFERPILHGLCTFGFAGRALLHTICGDDPARFRTMEGRFAKPAYPGDGLATEIWVQGDTALFETKSARGEALIERGVFTFAKE